MAEGRSNSAIAQRLVVSERAVSKHCTSIFVKLDLPPSDDDNRRVLAVLAYLDSLGRSIPAGCAALMCTLPASACLAALASASATATAAEAAAGAAKPPVRSG
jgi:hypothetical protein